MNESSLISAKSMVANSATFCLCKVEHGSFPGQLRPPWCYAPTSSEQKYLSQFKQVKNFSQRAKNKINGNSKSIPNPFLA